ncbi:MAG: hypothetical protein JW818_14065 [Pirellulales bacterium]|nr:hypothetical protein [Pirellulales bacterium]
MSGSPGATGPVPLSVGLERKGVPDDAVRVGPGGRTGAGVWPAWLAAGTVTTALHEAHFVL